MNIYFPTSTLTQQSLKIFFNDMRMYEDGIMCRYGRLILNYVIVDICTFHAYCNFVIYYRLIITLIMKVYY